MKIFEIALYDLLKINGSYNISHCFLSFSVVMLYETGNFRIPYNVSLYADQFDHGAVCA